MFLYIELVGRGSTCNKKEELIAGNCSLLD
jgi:hypothetical protein